MIWLKFIASQLAKEASIDHRYIFGSFGHDPIMSFDEMLYHFITFHIQTHDIKSSTTEWYHVQYGSKAQ